MKFEELKCPKCGTPVPRCSRQYGIRRKYLCPKKECRFTFWTREAVEATAERQMFQMWLRGFMKGEETNGHEHGNDAVCGNPNL